jgi:hypothetical protein
MFYETCARSLREGVDANHVKELIKANRPLFRPKAPTQLEAWKKKREEDRKFPEWLSGNTEEEKLDALNNLEAEQTFRSQFRVGPQPKGKDYPDPAPVEVIEWGLQYIDRRRKAMLEFRDTTAKQWQIIAVAVIGIANILVTIVGSS